MTCEWNELLNSDSIQFVNQYQLKLNYWSYKQKITPKIYNLTKSCLNPNVTLSSFGSAPHIGVSPSLMSHSTHGTILGQSEMPLDIIIVCLPNLWVIIEWFWWPIFFHSVEQYTWQTMVGFSSDTKYPRICHSVASIEWHQISGEYFSKPKYNPQQLTILLPLMRKGCTREVHETAANLYILSLYVGRERMKQFHCSFKFISLNWKIQGYLPILISKKLSLGVNNILDSIRVVANNNSTINHILLLGFDFFGKSITLVLC